jgi:hypothetical protein
MDGRHRVMGSDMDIREPTLSNGLSRKDHAGFAAMS